MTDEIDVEKLKAYAKLVFGALGGAMTAAMIHLGDRLGLYQALADGEALTSGELAARTGCAPRSTPQNRPTGSGASRRGWGLPHAGLRRQGVVGALCDGNRKVRMRSYVG